MQPVDRRELAAIFTGGFAGAIARALLVDALPPHPGRWPWATFLANVAGATLLGYVATRLEGRHSPPVYWRPLLATGFCGALTTFSTLQLELLQMLDRHDYALALGYTLGSVAAGLAGVALASSRARRAEEPA